MSQQYEVGRDTTGCLTEVRTVLSRAQTALKYPGMFSAETGGAEMRAALEAVVELLLPWEKTGKPLKGQRCENPSSFRGWHCTRPKGHPDYPERCNGAGY